MNEPCQYKNHLPEIILESYKRYQKVRSEINHISYIQYQRVDKNIIEELAYKTLEAFRNIYKISSIGQIKHCAMYDNDIWRFAYNQFDTINYKKLDLWIDHNQRGLTHKEHNMAKKYLAIKKLLKTKFSDISVIYNNFYHSFYDCKYIIKNKTTGKYVLFLEKDECKELPTIASVLSYYDLCMYRYNSYERVNINNHYIINIKKVRNNIRFKKIKSRAINAIKILTEKV